MPQKIIVSLLLALVGLSAQAQEVNDSIAQANEKAMAEAKEVFLNAKDTYRQAKKDYKEASDRYRNAHLWRRSRTQKTLAWTFLPTGFCMFGVGAAFDLFDSPGYNFNYSGNSNWVYYTLEGLGLGLMVASVPLFVASHRNKRRAYEVSAQPTFINSKTSFGADVASPALSLCLNF